ncbi:post-GPI attachment to proteins factor 2-like [Mya arenaria]|uniref:post-GPI attachment to proteins factor 2-like n=1 Tax=Mya arenaria TaxID=6604 RepID=UPI0022E6A2D9|nr:post-GPI attachment to proteins factor 2-like [Mya arenaria]
MLKNTLCYLKFSYFGPLICSLPALATIITVVYSLLFDLDGSTRTHCGVPNFLPTVSACISRRPQCYIWRILIALHAAPRFLFAPAWYSYHSQVYVAKGHDLYTFLTKAAIFFYIVENFMLVVLSCVSSTENRAIHENSFIIFIVCSWLFMLTTLYLCKMAARKDLQDQKSYRLKKIFAFFNLACFSFATYLYFRHNSYCEPYVYSAFALFEYLTIFTNIFFHGTLTIDIREYAAGMVRTDLILKQR